VTLLSTYVMVTSRRSGRAALNAAPVRRMVSEPIPLHNFTMMPRAPRIPKRMSFFWAGGAMSWLRYLTLASFRRLNPDWEMRLYHCPTSSRKSWNTGESLDAQDYAGPDYGSRIMSLKVQPCEVEAPLPDLSPNYASDLWRFQYLSTTGGWYSDLDILWVRPMAALRHATADAGAVVCQTAGVIGVGFLGGEPQCAMWQGICAAAFDGFSPPDYQSAGVLPVHYHAEGLDGLRRRYPSTRLMTVPDATVYPWDYRQVDHIFGQRHTVPDNCIGIHWFGGHPESQKWNCRMTEDTYQGFDSTFAFYANQATPSSISAAGDLKTRPFIGDANVP
jgi:Glycosyltransferase sugar-binding region containing DXD motif